MKKQKQLAATHRATKKKQLHNYKNKKNIIKTRKTTSACLAQIGNMATMASDQTTAQQVTSFFYLLREAPVEKTCFLGTDHPGAFAKSRISTRI